MNVNNKKGFTLVELLVVIAIIGLLSTIAIVSLGSARAKARDTKRIADMKQVATALEQYFSDQGGYPSVTTAGTYIVLGSTNAKMLVSTNTTAAGTATGSFGAAGSSGTVYMGNIPSYPTPGKSGVSSGCATAAANADYCYTSGTTWAAGTFSTTYTMVWGLENTNPAAGLTGTNCTTTPNGVTCS